MMETKRPNRTQFDTLSNSNAADRSHQPGRRTPREPSPRPTAPPMERERERSREEEWRREREMERMKDKTRHRGKDAEPRERCPERDRPPAPRGREGEREWRDRERRQDAEKRPNGGRPVSNLETVANRLLERGEGRKGDTFPRMRKHSKERDGRMDTFTTGRDAERRGKRPTGRQNWTEMDDRERERERAQRRERHGDGGEKHRERERGGGRPAGGGEGTGGRSRERERQRERRQERDSEGNDLWSRREKHTGRERERPRPGSVEREGRMPSPRTRRERDTYSDRESGEREGRDGRRDTRSEGDSDGEARRGRVEDREREELRFRHCRSEGDSEGKVTREKDGERLRCVEEEERHRDRERGADRARAREEGRERGAERDVERYRDMARRKERGGERQRDDAGEIRGSGRDDRQPRDRREGDQFRARKGEDRRHGDRETEGRREEAAGGRCSRPPGETAPRPPPRVQSSGGWSGDVDCERRRQRARDGHEERECGREGTADRERDVEVEVERGPREHKRRGRTDREREEDRMAARAEHKRMWLEPPGTYKKDSSLEDEVTGGERRTGRKERQGGGEERGREGQREREEHEVEESHSDQSKSRGEHYDSERRDTEKGGGRERRCETEGVSVDGEEVSEAWREGDGGGKERLPSGDGGSTEGSGPRLGERERERVTDDTEASDREEEGGSDSYSRSGSEGGSERGWERERDRILSGEDGFVTGSSGGGGEGGRDEEDFEDCRDFWDGSKGREGERVEEEGEKGAEGHGAEKHPQYVFCVIGQTLPQSKPNQESELDPTERPRTNNNPNSGSSRRGSDDITHRAQNELQPVPGRDDEYNTNDNRETKRKGDECNTPTDELSHTDKTSEMDVRCGISSQEGKTGDGEKSTPEHPYAEIGPMNRDSETEKLLAEWRERNEQEESERERGLPPSPIDPYGEVGFQGNFVPIQASPDANNPTTMTPEEEVAIRIRMSGAWSMAEEAKRRSQAPHLKWAQNVMREILGSSEDHGSDDPQVASRGGQEVNQPERGTTTVEEEEEVAAAYSGELPVYATVQKARETHNRNSEAELDEVEEMEPLEVEEQRDDEDGKSASWGEVDLRNVLDTMGRRKRNSKFFNAAQLYQQYSEAAQNNEILRQARSDVLICDLISEDQIAPVPSSSPPSSPTSPAPSPPPARRPLPPLPAVPHPHSLSHVGSVTGGSAPQNLSPPEPPRSEGMPSSSPRLSISLGQSATLWQDLPGVRNSVELEELTGDQRCLQEVRFEVVTSEASYCRSLDIVVEHFVKSKQLGSLLTTQDRSWLFSRLADVRAISHSFLSKLEERVESDIMLFAVCDIIARHCQRFKMVYVPYLTNQSYQDATYQRLMDENQGFKRVVDKLERSPVCQRLPLRSFLILPFQRITRIKLLVQNIVKRTAPGTEEVMQAIKALRLLEKLIQESNDSITQMKSIESLVSLSAKVDFECRTLPLISQSRRLVREGPVTELMDFSLKDTERSVFFHLFNDYLLVSLHKEGGRFTVIDHAPVSDLRAENCRVKLHSLQKNLFRLHLSSKALLLRTDNQSDKLRWISAVSRPHPPIDFSAAQDFIQMQCIRAFVAHQPDELSLEKADILLVHQKSGDRWVEGTRLADRHRGWMPESHLETITNARVRQRNLLDALKLNTATAAV